MSDLTTQDHILRRGHVVISDFDGVHLGHLELLQRAANNAAGDGGPVVAVLIEGPSGPVNARLTDRDQTVRLLANAGAEVVVLEADEGSAQPAPLCALLHEKLAPRSIVASAGKIHGTDVEWTPDQLAAGAESAGIRIDVLPALALPGRFGTLSATAIRSYLTAGNIQAANALLGRCWAIEGSVVHGHKRGRELGFPTANVKMAHVDLAYAIYAVRVHLGERLLDGVASYGTRPQFDNGAPILEVHILDFAEQIYGEHLHVEFIAYQRPEITFASVDDLKVQMAADLDNARSLLQAAA